ncbi:MAG: dihydrofolate reductase [Proteobacteria bacterium]|nr:dihydrofolate reductase [Pseudomonadota bacterium]
MILSAIVAVSENNVIGVGNGLPWRLSNDLKWFRQTTMGKPIIMGRKTFESLPRILPGRTNIIITRDPDYQIEGAIVTHSLEAAIEAAKNLENESNSSEVVIIGGAEIYRQSMSLLDRIYLTRVHADVAGDTYFPDLEMENWSKDFAERHEKSEKDAYDHSFTILNRVNKD